MSSRTAVGGMTRLVQGKGEDYKSSRAHLHGLDQLRLLAALLIFVQHTLSCSGHDEWIDVAGFRVGRVGTAIFFMLSGFLAATSRRPAFEWFIDRLRFLLPTFWIVTGIGFVLAAIGGRKEFDAWQVVCQFSGFGYFTHGERLINIATWFLSPLLVLYAAVAVAKHKSCRWLSLIVTLFLLVTATLKDENYATLYCHGAVFFLTYSVCTYWPKLCRNMTPMLPLGLAFLSLIQPEFRYGAVASILLTFAIKVQSPNRIASTFSRIAYEWFLTQGICLSLAMRITEMPLLLGLIGAVLSLFAAVSLKYASTSFFKFISTRHEAIAERLGHPTLAENPMT